MNNNDRCWNPETPCRHARDRHDERGACVVDECNCAAFMDLSEVCTCGHELRKHGKYEDLLRECTGELCNCPGFEIPAVPGKVVQKWADAAMFTSEPLDAQQGPKVYLLAMNTDPLGSVAAAAKMYKGEVVRDLSEVTDEERRYYLAELQKTKLTTPLEAVNFHFLIEGVTRSFTHQLVRQRTAAYAQESLRFAVVEDGFADRVALPPSLAGTDEAHSKDWREMTPSDKNRLIWDSALARVGEAYKLLVEAGMPAEDARGLLPHNITTRVHYTTNLRALLDHAGNRLCTQAQFEWRLVWARIVEAIRSYDPRKANAIRLNGEDPGKWEYPLPDQWQFEALANIFKPVCYQTGKCAFAADFDRKCSIRNRVQANADLNRPPSEWGEELDEVHEFAGDPIVSGVGPQSVVRTDRARPVFIGSIQPAEWLLDPGAAR